MDYIYAIENKGNGDTRDNSKLFKIIRDREISEDRVYFDTDEGIQALLEELDYGDRLIVLSVMDLADSIKELQALFKDLTEYETILYSLEEPVFRESKYSEILDSTVYIIKEFREKRRVEAYKISLKEGKVGRPTKAKELEIAVKLYKTGEFTIQEIESIAKISKSSIYNYLNQQK